ncbi:MAG: hypothetical protein SFY56_09650 [Bacteroidota bacterium]|nr:hypothetical protein [Bacteroidota bacterium]
MTKKITYEGTVYDTDTINKRKPVDGAIIELFACSTSQEKASYYCSGNQIFIGKATSDASGHFKIKEKAANSGAYFIYLNGKPYNHARISVQDLSGYYSNIYTIFVK